MIIIMYIIYVCNVLRDILESAITVWWNQKIQLMHCVTSTVGDRLTDEELEDILQSIDLDVDYEGNIKYEGKVKSKGKVKGKIRG